MNAKNTPQISCAVIMLLACLTSAHAVAEVKAHDKFGDWVVECHNVAPDKNNCTLTQTVISAEKKVPLIKMIFGRNAEGPFFSTLVPLGIKIADGVRVTIDDEKGLPMVINTCIAPGCIAVTKLDAKLVKSFQHGKKLLINYTMNGADKPANIGGSGNGLLEGLKNIGL